MDNRQWTPSERREWLARQHADAIRERALQPPALTGTSWEDLGNADEFLDRAEAAWDRADLAYREAQTRAASSLDPADSLEAGHLRVEADRLWQAREQAVRHRDRLLEEFGG